MDVKCNILCGKKGYQLPERLNYPGASNDRPNGTVRVPSGVSCWGVWCQSHRLVDETKDLTVQYIRKDLLREKSRVNIPVVHYMTGSTVRFDNLPI